ncbi:PD-(D/E)XK nuclease family protein [Flagellimonas nanhaiensis]|uniref:PD-(D/E)XK nuclease family protein n=1 Tax=Flagellimonas nanhaiensis TaxID=2292706 RepID=A0A371JRY3_9FLAO|nr:PD-(D/E)XK nuclease family protein [Allomuricauda nanhaiensis]RDY60259.1 PD-(D/E)XK nuclease family protein [Allomuricauda nanhaiensis]
MHKSFLEYVLDDLQKQETDFATCTFVLPSKRSGTFLKKYLSNILDQNIFGPEVLSIQDFVSQISGLSPASNIDLLLLLFDVYKKSKVDSHDDFASFLKWGNTLLQDFNDIDGYLIPPGDILNYLSAIKEINHWSAQKNQTDLIKNYLQLWNQLESIYNDFNSCLLAQKKGYQGLISKTAVDNLNIFAKSHKNKPIIFVGLNALTNAESQVVQYFLEQGNSKVYWDIDSYFFNDPVHDAGLFIRNYKHTWGYYKDANIAPQNNFLSPKNISITGVPKSISQTKYVGQLLQKLKVEGLLDVSRTALVLADETLLPPMTKAIPSSITGVNITMGLPLEKTVLYSFFLSLLELNSNPSDRGWFYEGVLNFMSNPYTQFLSTSEKTDFARSLTKETKEKNWLYITKKELKGFMETSNVLEFIFPEKEISSTQWIDNCLQLIQRLKQLFEKEENPLELEQLYRFFTLFNQLRTFTASVSYVSELKSVKSLFKQLASMETLDYIGEPLTGLQIMGMLESRNLDFETVIITSVNEGILPSGKSNNSFIPFDVKRDYGLPTYKEKDAIYTYHFYRLIQRAKNIHIIYNTEPDVLEGGEKSRLISQLLTDENLAPYITHTVTSPEVSIEAAQPIEIGKSPQLMEDIKAFAHRGFSPTSLTNYIRNPIEFYTRNILNINDLEEVEENIAANTFGTIIHDSLEELYTPLIGKILNSEHLQSLKRNIQDVVQYQFRKNLPGTDITKGKFLLVNNVIIKYLQNFLSLEEGLVQKHQIKILSLEKKYETLLSIPELGFPVKLKGTLDRVDEIDGVPRIVDYKTGRVEPRHVKISDWDDLIANYDKSKAFQLLCYSFLYAKEYQTDSVVAGIYSFKNLKQGFLAFNSSNSSFVESETLTLFETYLKRLVLEICDVNIPFVEKTDS